MPGWKARIGILSPSVFETPSDWDLILPYGFTLVATGLNVRVHSAKEFDKAIAALESTLSVFSAEEVDAILLNGITLGTQKGYKVEQEIVASLIKHMGLPITTALNANVEALKYLNAKSIVIATAYNNKINQAVGQYFEDAGLNVLGISGLNVSKPVDQVKLPQYASYRASLKLICEHSEADAVLIHGRWSSIAYVDQLEKDTARTVVSSSAASLWWILKRLGMRIPIDGYGKLLS